MTAVPRGKTGVSMRPVTQRGPGLEEGESEAVKASEVTNGKEAHGQQLLMATRPEATDNTSESGDPILVLNWFEELTRLVPTN